MSLFLKAVIRLSDPFFKSREPLFLLICLIYLSLQLLLYLFKRVNMSGKYKIEIYICIALIFFCLCRVQQHDLKYDWHKLMKQQDSNTTTHEQAFLVICWHLQSKCLVTIPQPPSEANEKSGFDGLEERIRQKVAKNDVAKCQLWCVFSIRNRASFWKSTLKVVVQFMDLWIRYS